jgi:hypothetical protein
MSDRVVYIAQLFDEGMEVVFGGDADRVPTTHLRRYFPVSRSSLDRINRLVAWHSRVTVHLSPYISVWARFPAKEK